MSCTEIFGFDKEGNAYLQDEIKNSWRGAMAIWNILEQRYLPQYRPSFIPDYIADEDIEDYCKYKPSRTSAMFDKNAMQEIWDLANDKRLKDNEKIVLSTTFDDLIIKKENFKQ
jgi:hypothetical protein